MSSRKIYISVEPHEKRLAIVKAQRLERYYVERPESGHILGNIYKGTVSAIVGNIDAAFVDIGLEKNGFLYVSDILRPGGDYEEMLEEDGDSVFIKGERGAGRKISDVVKKGDELIAQVAKEALGSKGVRLTTHIGLPGRYLVFLPYEAHMGVSKRIGDPAERKRLKGILNEIKIPKGAGAIVRTAGAQCGRKEFNLDIKYLYRLWRHIKGSSRKRRSPALLHQEYDITLRMLRDTLIEDVDAIYVDSLAEFKRMRRFINMLMPKFKKKLNLYSGKRPLFEEMNIEKEIEKIFNRKVYLKCGGYITIEQTEGLVAIDVNSGKFKAKRSPREMAFRVNSEAAREAARQMSLRNLGGIIIIDFIDMDARSERNKVFEILVGAMREDKAKTNILPISDIGIVQLTRQRVTRSLEGISYSACPCCRGRGLVRSASTMAIRAIREARSKIDGRRRINIEITAHPDVASKLTTDFRDSIRHIERQFRSRITINKDESKHIEEIAVITK